jgi:hypothetical protein
MKIIYLNQELNPDEEHEIFSDNEFGFSVHIEYKEDAWLKAYYREPEIVNNITEVHSRYKFAGKNDKIAFQSNIHNTGFNRYIDEIESVTIFIDDSLKENI